ncbi:MlaD family protein [Pseudooceanicola sp. HF7]|uniref:MlaD family protein n=1 Tax=Pseudooceanicola sp. HF7 TaxID=2721560 RepID=UPI00142FC9BA|nr:MlaD family protein [Pseudooceanicola sp. HF7]NIZ10106.1 MCE family protein [Pseudooceanicola sp. HF7]
MSDFPPPEMPETESRLGRAERLSIIWIVPLIALAIAVGVAWHNWAKRGETIRITFDSAEGIAANQTELRYRDVSVGMVENLGFSKDLKKVVATVRLNPEVEDYVDSSASFWVVRPEVTTRGVSGLGTVLSGVYIEGSWDGEAGGLHREFVGASQPPLNASGRPGLKILLRAANQGGLTSNAPIEFRGIEVGEMGEAKVSADGTTVEAEAIIYSPHDKMISTATRFWDTSGFRFSIGTGGAKLDFTSLSSLLSGGLTFSAVVSGGQSVEEGAMFTVYPDEDTARATVFAEDGGPSLTFSAIFDDNVPGLTAGSAVTYGGLNVGKVDAVNGIVDEARFGDDRVRLQASFQVDVGRVGLGGGPDSTDPEDPMAFFDRKVKQEGLRARLATGSIFTGGLKIEMVLVDNAPEAEIARVQGLPNPVFPTAENNITDVTATAEGVFQRINDLPIEQLMQSAIGTLDNISRLTGSADVQAVPGDVRALLGDARGLIGAPQMQALPAQIGSVADQVEELVQALNTRDLAGRLSDAIQSISDAAGGVNTAVAGVPQLVDSFNAVAQKAESVPINELADQLTQLVGTADRLLSTPGAQELPESMSKALDELRSVLSDLREGGVINNLNETLASARGAADNIAQAAQDLPDLLAQAQRVLSQAGTTLQGYDASSGVGRQLNQTLREIDRAASAIAALARELERNPNSLLFGR